MFKNMYVLKTSKNMYLPRKFGLLYAYVKNLKYYRAKVILMFQVYAQKATFFRKNLSKHSFIYLSKSIL